MKVRHRCKMPGCMNMSRNRDLCVMHYSRWRHWGDPASASRKAAALALATALLGCTQPAQAPEQLSPPLFVVPAGFVLVPRNVADEFAQEINALRDDNLRLQIDAAKWRSKNDCS